MKMRLTMAVLIVVFCAAAHAATVYDVATLNGHPGYLTAMEVSPDNVIDKVILLAEGFDTDNDDHPIDDINDEWQPLIDVLGPQGWDVILFDYVRGDIDIRDNADNLADFIGYLDTIAVPNYHFALVGGSMGGIVCRTMLVQEYSDMGVDTFVTVDSPHYGVYLSEWVEDLAAIALDQYFAAHQMHHGDDEYDILYGWLSSVENSGTFKPTILNPMASCAIALSDGESSWDVDWGDLIIHNKYYGVSCIIYEEGLTSTYMPYHSVCLFDSGSTSKSVRWFYNRYHYNSTATSYFDTKVPNPVDEHSAPEYAVQQAVDFILAND